MTYPLNGKTGNAIGAGDARITEAAARLAGVQRGIVLAVSQTARSVAAARESTAASVKARESAELALRRQEPATTAVR